MDEIQVMTVIQLKSASDALVSKMVSAAYRIPFKIMGICFRCNVRMLYLVVDGYLKISDILQSIVPFKFICGGKANETEDVDTKEIIRGVRKIRRSVLAQIDRDYGLKFQADNELAVKRLDELRDSMTENEKFQEALGRIDEMNESFREERQELFKNVELEFDQIIEEINEDERVGNVNERNDIEETIPKRFSNISLEQEASIARYLNGTRKPITSNRKNGVSKNRLYATNVKLEEILKVSSTLVGELSKLNHQVGHLAEVSGRMADMQYKLSEGRKLLSEVEADRNVMKRKLVTLERLIKEEEKYLDEFSYESGFEECEMPVSL